MTESIGANDLEKNWFEKALQDYDYKSPDRGQFLDGVILRVDEEGIVVDIGQKRDAIVLTRELAELAPEIIKNIKVGDQVVVCVIRPPEGDEELLVSLSKGIEYASWQQAEEHLKNGMVLELEVIGQNKGGLLVEFETLNGFVPASQIPDLRRVRDHQHMQQVKLSFIGKLIPLKAIEVDRQRRRLVFSMLAAQEQRRKERLGELEVGQVIPQAQVVSIVDFGLFVDLEGVDGLVYISELDWQRIGHPAKHFKIGEKIDVKVIEIDVEKERIGLSRKALLPSPWDELKEKHNPGDVLSGRVTRVMDFGAFVELSEGVVGLVHASEIGYISSGKPQEVVKAGDTVLVKIIEIDVERERVSLSMRRVPREQQIAWMTETIEDAQLNGEEDPDKAGES